MKLYDFQCKKCGKEFEDLVRDISEARCPACESADVEKQLSVFAIGGGGSRREPAPTGGSCGSGFCGGGGCGLN